MALSDQTNKMLEPKKDETFFDKYVAGEKTKGMFNPTAKDVIDVGTDFIPGVSETKDIISLGTNVNKGEYKSAGIDLASLILGAVPVVGDLARRGFKTLTKNVGKSEDIISKQADEVGESLQKVYGNIKPPTKTVKAYKLFKTDKKGNLYPLFVKMQGNKPLELNKWTKAEAGEINPKTGKVKSSLGDLAYRPGFHGGDLPIATHIGGKKGKVTKPNYRKDNQVWAEVEFGDDVDWQSVANSRALKNKDGSTQVKTAHITDQVPEGGVYRYKTNPNMTGNWLIGGELKINRILPDKEVKKINNKAGVADLPRLKDLQLAEGGTAMKKQMELFEDGGLKDEGGMVDEVSGNDVPTGSTREEVRDDIPAQLSEGEFVFPADVVRYIGLAKLMRLRQEAKQGLKQMEAMGQMGNSDEATMDDDLPFDETDLDIEDDLEYNRGGVIQAQQGTYVAPTIPIGSQPLGTNPMGNPTQIMPQQVASGVSGASRGTPYVPNVGNVYGAGATPYAPVSYQDFLGPSAGGAPQTETVRYFNEATGQTRMIPHIVNADGSRGATLYPIPDGFVIQEEAPKEEAKKAETKVESAKVKPVESGDNNDSGPTTSAVDPAGDPLSYQSIFSMDALDKNLANLGKMQLGSFNMYSNITSGVQGKANVNALSTGAITGSFINAKNALGRKGVNVSKLSPIERMELNNAIETAKVAVRDVSVDDEGNSISQKDVINNINTLAKAYGLKEFDKSKLGRNFNLDVQLGKKLAEILVEREKDIKDKETGDTFDRGFTDATSLGMESLGMAQQQGIQDAIESGKGSLDTSGIDTSGISSNISDDSFSDDQGQSSGDGVGESGPSGQGDPSGFGGTYKGSLITRKKPKPKKMKRGGLASR